MIVVRLDAASLARVRLAASPVTEAVMWLWLTATGGRHGVFGDPGAAARYTLRDPDVALLARVLAASSTYIPDLLTPKPVAGSAKHALRWQLETIRETPRQAALTQLAGYPDAGDEVRHAAERGTFAARAANGLRTFWRHTLADGWPGLHGRIQADLAIRSRLMVEHGIGAVLGSIHPSVVWTGLDLHVHKDFDDEMHFTEDELVLVPSVLAWPKVLAQLCDPARAVLCYPAHGVGVSAAGPNPGALARLLGNTRAALLRDLDVPRSTTDLSKRHQLAPATVSYHLRVLHSSGLVTRLRDRRTVLYRRTEQGDALHD